MPFAGCQPQCVRERESERATLVNLAPQKVVTLAAVVLALAVVPTPLPAATTALAVVPAPVAVAGPPTAAAAEAGRLALEARRALA